MLKLAQYIYVLNVYFIIFLFAMIKCKLGKEKIKWTVIYEKIEKRVAFSEPYIRKKKGTNNKAR